MRVIINREITQRTVPARELETGEFFRMAETPGKTYIYLGITPKGTCEALRYYPSTTGVLTHAADITIVSPEAQVTRLDATLDTKDA